MIETNGLSLLQEFRTVVTGYRMHGQLLQNQSQQYLFSLTIQSSSNKQQINNVIFDSQGLKKHNLIESFAEPKALYDHLSKMTKMKVKFDNQGNNFSIIYEKEKILKEFFVNLEQIKNQQAEFDKKQISMEFSKQKETDFQGNFSINNQQESQLAIETEINKHESFLKNQNNQPEVNLKQKTKVQPLQQVNQASKTNAPQKVEDKIELLKKMFQNIQARDEKQKSVREKKKITYQFTKQQAQSLTLYEYALEQNIQLLTDLIESQQLEKTQEILLKRQKTIEIPPFNQIGLEFLISLCLEENKVTQIKYLDRMPNLQKLNLDGNKITKIQNLENLSNLKVLKLGNNDISQILGLQKLVNLQTLWLDFNSISKIEGLATLTKLKSLNLSFNLIKKIQNLQKLSVLEELLLNENQITQIENLEALSKLTRLSMNMNSIQKVRGLKKNLLLEVVHLNQNLIEDFDKNTFDEFNWLKMLKQLKLSGNLISWGGESLGFVQRLKNYGTKVVI